MVYRFRLLATATRNYLGYTVYTTTSYSLEPSLRAHHCIYGERQPGCTRCATQTQKLHYIGRNPRFLLGSYNYVDRAAAAARAAAAMAAAATMAAMMAAAMAAAALAAAALAAALAAVALAVAVGAAARCDAAAA